MTDPTLSRPYHRKPDYISGTKDGVSFEIIETQPGNADVYLNKDLDRGEVLDLLSIELTPYYLGTIHKLEK